MATDAARPGISKVCHPDDWRDAELRGWMASLHDPRVRALVERGVRVHRKDWEHAMALRTLDRVGALGSGMRALCVAGGHQATPYRLAHLCGEVRVTRLYGETGFADDAASPAVLDDPTRLAPFGYPRERLHFEPPDARVLDLPDGSFDVVLSLGSIERPGGDEGVRFALAEMARVARPGGHVALASEWIVQGRHPELFDPGRFERLLARPPRLELVGPFDARTRVERPRALHPGLGERVARRVANAVGRHPEFPHVFLTDGRAVWTSFHVLYRRR